MQEMKMALYLLQFCLFLFGPFTLASISLNGQHESIIDFQDHRLDLTMSSASSCNVSCALDGSNANFTWDTATNDEFTIIKSNLCPLHIFQNAVGDNPNDACVQDEVQFYLPKQPYFISNSSGTNDAILTTMNPIGFTLSGVALYGPAINSYGGDAVKHEIDTFDYCGGHADPDGIEHYHSEPYCVAEAAKRHPEDGMINPGNNHSVMYGWISDGFPVYGPFGDGGVVPTDLDECQGHSGDSGAGGGYHYHYSGPTGAYQYDSFNGSGYPYFLACFKGCISSLTENSVSIAQDDPYPVCKSSGTKAPAGNYSGDFFKVFNSLNFTEVEKEFVYADTDAPTAAPSPLGCTVFMTMYDTMGDGWNGYTFSLYSSSDHTYSTPLQNLTLSDGSQSSVCLDVEADTCYKLKKSKSGSKAVEISWDLCGHSGEVITSLSFCTDSNGFYGNCNATTVTSSPSTFRPTIAPTTATPTTAVPTASPTTPAPTPSPTTASPTSMPTTASPTISSAPTLMPTTASPTTTATSGAASCSDEENDGEEPLPQFLTIAGARWELTRRYNCPGNDLTKLLVDGWMGIATVEDRYECAEMCLMTHGCVSFNYPLGEGDGSQQMCWIKHEHRMSEYLGETCSSGNRDPGWDFYSLIDPCENGDNSGEIHSDVATYHENVGWCWGMDYHLEDWRDPGGDHKSRMYACWEACYAVFGEALVAVDGPCYCQDACDWLACDGQSIWVRNDHSELPNNCNEEHEGYMECESDSQCDSDQKCTCFETIERKRKLRSKSATKHGHSSASKRDLLFGSYSDCYCM